MIPLAPSAATAYLRALDAALRAVGLGADHPSLEVARRVVRALDPQLSGELFLPAAASAHSGMPVAAWWARALAESRAAPSAPIPSTHLAALGDRMRRRAAAREALGGPLPEWGRARARVRRTEPTLEIEVSFDLVAPDDCPVRVRVALQPGRRAALTCRGDDVRLDPRVEALFARGWRLPLGALADVLAEGLGGRVVGLARGQIGPAWFPGVALPAGIPEGVGRGFVLQARREALGEAEGLRFASGAASAEALAGWIAEAGLRAPVTRF